MKNLLSATCFLSIILFCSNKLYAQPSWQWAVTSEYNDTTGYDLANMVVDHSGNVIFAGEAGIGPVTIGTTSVGSAPLIIVKIDSSGSVLWSVQSGGIVVPIALVVDSADNIYFLGYYEVGFTGITWDTTATIGPITLSSTYDQYFLTKISPSGTVLWAQNVSVDGCASGYGGVEGLTQVEGYLGIDNAGYIYVSGSFNQRAETIGSTILVNTDTSGETSDIFLAKYDSSGHSVWARTIYGDQNDGVNTMAIANDGSIYLSGSSNSDSLMFTTATLYSSYTFMSGGFSTNYINFLTKLDTAGNVIWAKKINVHLGIYGLATDKNGDFYLSGYYDSSIVWAGDTLAVPLGNEGSFISRNDSSGSLIWVNNSVSAPYQWGFPQNCIAIDTCGNVWVSGPGDSVIFDHHLLYSTTTAPDPSFIVEFNSLGNYMQGMVLPSGGDDQNTIALDGAGNIYVAGDYYGTSMTFGAHILPFVPDPPSIEEQLYLAKYRYTTSGCDEDGPLNNTLTRATVQVALYPNPGTNRLTITATDKITTLAISNLLGQTVFSNYYHNEEVQIDVANLPTGVYFVKINGTEVRKFVKE